MAHLSASANPRSLDRFLAAQTQTYETALAELAQGHKRSHWMWFIFPQLRGLGQSSTAQFYGIADRDEADRYLAHPVLRMRLLSCAEAVLNHTDLSAEDILGLVDAVKLRSSATLFAVASADDDIFIRVLGQFFENMPCSRTLQLLRAEWPPSGSQPSRDGAE
ncbi:DUF1810 domain-containing protein [Paracoccus sp. ME4]|uniref:DUF1810 domain-containing protein n=1 Tax=Paracoccus sp. ME4 TaxID=3138066 RepID=UPI00398A9E94